MNKPLAKTKNKNATKLMPLASLDPSKVQIGRPLLSDLSAWLPSEGVQNVTLGLVGSCVRDQFHGKPPRKLTVAVVGADKDTTDQVLRALDLFFSCERGGSHVLQGLYAFDGDVDDYQHHSIAQYRNVHEGGLPIEVRIYADRFVTLADVTDAMDNSVDQFVAWFDQQGNFLAHYFGSISTWGQGVQLLNVTDDEIEEAQRACDSIGWVYEEYL